jgi:hypothetical protein
MILTTNLPGRRPAPPRPAGSTLWASIDVEWTKNYRIKNGNKPFCFSVVYLALPDSGEPTRLVEKVPFGFISVYIGTPTRPAPCLAAANDVVRAAFAHADRITGHQFTSDLGVLANASPEPLPALTTARTPGWTAVPTTSPNGASSTPVMTPITYSRVGRGDWSTCAPNCGSTSPNRNCFAGP